MSECNNENRISILCCFDSDGMIGEDILFLTEELRKVSSRLIVVVNGELKNREELVRADRIIVRDNQGYDIGAYTSAIKDAIVNAWIREADELVLCNSSFYGPFISFREIFAEAKDRGWDFWGLSENTTGINRHIQSYFIVYRKNILKSECFYDYFEGIDETKGDHKTSCALFENGFVNYLERHGFSWGALHTLKCNNIKNPLGSLCLDKIPVLKKKVFADIRDRRVMLGAVLAFIKEHSTYDIKFIIDDVRRRYDFDIDIVSIQRPAAYIPQKDDFSGSNKVAEELEDFIKDNRKVYLYGCGEIGSKVFSRYFMYSRNEDKMSGFIISDDKVIDNDRFLNMPVYHFSEVCENDPAVIVALSHRDTEEVRKKLSSLTKVFYIAREIPNVVVGSSLTDPIVESETKVEIQLPDLYIGNERWFEGTLLRNIADSKLVCDFQNRELRQKMIMNHCVPGETKQKNFGTAICGIFKNEGPYLREWIEYHIGIGVDHFYLYNNNSDDNYGDILAPYIENNRVTLIDWPYSQTQLEAYENCINLYRDDCDWIGFIDIDEFVVIRDGRSITEFLEPFRKNRPSVVFYWKVFGSNGYDERDVETPVTEAFVSCNPDFCTNGKCFYNTAYSFDRSCCKGGSFHHRLFAKCGEVALPPVNVFDHVSYRTWNLADSLDFPAWINHYALKSKQEYQIRMSKTDVFFNKNPHNMDYFNYYDSGCTVKDYTISNLRRFQK